MREVNISEATRFWLALSLVPGFSRSRLLKAQQVYSDPSSVLGEPAGILEALKLPGELRKRWPPERFERELELVAELGATVLSPSDPAFPRELIGVKDGPSLLYAWGAVLPDDRERSIAIVGTRQASVAGLETARRLAFELAVEGVTVLSGMARGIDSAAHKGALEAKGRTVAILAGGLSRPYPPENRALFRAIGETGLVLTEYCMRADPFLGAFLRRNRWIAALSSVVVLVESPNGSGALNTASHAREIGRPLMVAPGPMYSPTWAGSNGALRDGAKIVTEAGDVLAQLGITKPAPEVILATQGELWPPNEQRVRDCLAPMPVPLEELLERTGLTANEVRAALVSLELSGGVRRHPGPLYGLP